MPLRIRILLWVSALFIITIFFIFVIGTFELNYSLTNEKNNLTEKVEEVAKENSDNIEKYVGINFANAAEKMVTVFEYMRTGSQWRLMFLPTPYNIETKAWGNCATTLSTFPWLDMINVEINDEDSACIYESAPYLYKFLKIPVAEDLTLFATIYKGKIYSVYVGVPFWSNSIIEKYIDDSKFPAFFLAEKPDQWLIYDVDELLAIEPSKLKMKNQKIYREFFEASITINSELEFEFLFNSLKMMLEVTKKNLLAQKGLIEILSNESSKTAYLEKKINEIHPEITYERNYCTGPFCNFIEFYKDPPWSTRRDFQHKITQKVLAWELGMLYKTGVWDYSPFSKGAPEGIITDLALTTTDHPAFYKNILEGFLVKDVFLNKKIEIKKTCTLAVGNEAYDRKIIFEGDASGVATSCRNNQLEIIYNEDLREPYLTNTNYITYFKPPMTKPNISAITLGIALDPLFLSLAIVSPDDIAFIFGDGHIRLYSRTGEITNIKKDANDASLKRLLNEKEGSLVLESGEELYYTYLTQITENDGKILLIEKQESRIAIINAINKHIKLLTHRVFINSAVLIIISLIITMIVLSRVIKAITKPINELAYAVTHLTDRTLDNVHFDTTQVDRQDEVGTLYKSFAEMIKSMKEGHKVRGLLDKVVSKEVAAKIVKEGIKLGGEKKILTVMFCDIRNFTSISEKMDPEDLIVMLNQCLTLLSGIIDDFEGVIDKYEGDKIMTLFGAPLETPNHSLKAVLCAIEMQKELDIWNSIRESSGLCRLDIGIGIHTGEAVAGNVGAENHLSYTVIGHIVNLSDRLCDCAKAKEILISKQTLDNVSDHIETSENEARTFKGMTEPVVTYSILYKK